jgi:hypothetical protein
MMDSVLKFLALELYLLAPLVLLDSVMKLTSLLLHGMFQFEVLLVDIALVQLCPLKKK